MSEHTSRPYAWIGILRLVCAVAALGALTPALSPYATAATPASLGTPAGAAAARKARMEQSYGRLPLSFEANQGQAAKSVRFVARGQGYGLYLTGGGAVLTLHKRGQNFVLREGQHSRSFGHSLEILRKLSRENNGVPARHWSEQRAEAIPSDARPDEAVTDVVQMQLAGARAGLKPAGLEMLPGTANYILGKDSSKWHTDVPTYARVSYAGVYPGVDLVYYGNQRQLEYDFVVAPGASPRPIQLRFDGAKSVKLDGSGNLVIAAANGEVELQKPEAYQMEGAQRRPVEGEFRLLAHNRAGFRLGSYDRGKPLVIDPVLSYATYLGGSDWDYSGAIAVDGNGNAYVTGFTASLDFPATAGAYQVVNNAGVTNNASTAYVAKLNPSGTALIYSTYLGGSGNTAGDGDTGNGIAVDSIGNAYVAGWTYSNDFPVTASAYQIAPANQDATGFVSELNADGTGLLYSTYLGGSILDFPTTLVLDPNDYVYTAGFTFSSDFPTTSGAYQTKNNSYANGHGGWNSFVSKLNTKATGSASLVYSTFLGGSGETEYSIIFNDTGYYAAEGLAVDTLGDAYVEGFANSRDYPVTTGAYQRTNLAYASGGTNVTVSKLNPTGTGLVYSTYLGGSATVNGASTPGDYSTGLVIDSSGDAYVTGFTFSSDFPTTSGAFQTSSSSPGNGVETAFVSKLNPTGKSLVYSTFLGGSGEDDAFALAVDGTDDLYVAGSTASADFPVTAGAYQITNKAATDAGYAAFLTELNPAGSAELYSTFLGGSTSDSAYGVALGSGGAVYLTGFTESSDFPVTTGAFETKYNSAVGTAFIAEFDLGTAPTAQATATTLLSSANPQVPGGAVTFTATVKSGSGTPAGNVVFSVDEVAVATVALGGNGQATYLAPSLAQGQHYILASYEGNSTYASSGAGLTEIIQYPQPTISSLTPLVGTTGAGVMLTVNGTNYYSGATVTWGSTILTPTSVSATQLTAVVPLALVASPGSVEVTVTSLGGTSAPSTFTILGPTTTFPLLLSLSPGSMTPGGLSFTLTVNGANFATNSIVLWNGKARATQFVSSTKLTATILGPDIATQGTALVTVANSIANLVPKAELSAALPFAVQSSAAVATITGASLADTPASNGDYLLTLTGTGFLPDSTVQVYGGNGSLTTEYVSPYQISAVLTASDYLLLPAMVTVKNPSGISAGFEVQ